MALQPSIRVINGKVFGAYAAQAKNVAYGQGTVEDALDDIGGYYETEVPAGTDGAISAYLTLPAGKYVVVGNTGSGSASVTPLFTIHREGESTAYARALCTGRDFNLTAIVDLANSANIYFRYAGGNSITTTTKGKLSAIRIK